jgi:hypothetical protein
MLQPVGKLGHGRSERTPWESLGRTRIPNHERGIHAAGGAEEDAEAGETVFTRPFFTGHSYGDGEGHSFR